jgi:isoleucyl-tRNA synthetase
VAVATQEEQQAIQALEQLVLDELNVKKLCFVAQVSDLAGVRLKPNLQKLGPRFGAKRPMVDAAIAAMDPEHILSVLEADGHVGISVDGREEMIQRDEILVEETEKEGFSVETQGERAVGINTSITDELLDEGLARELVHKVQGLRKDAGLQIEDTIAVNLSGGPLAEVANRFVEFFQSETLCRELTYESESPSESYNAVIEIDGKSLEVSIRRIGSIK